MIHLRYKSTNEKTDTCKLLCSFCCANACKLWMVFYMKFWFWLNYKYGGFQIVTNPKIMFIFFNNKADLILFEAVYGLKFNFHKSVSVGMNIFDSWLHAATLVLNCKHICASFLYLGLPIKGDSRKLRFWNSLFDQIRKRLSRWKSIHLFMGGRLILLKSMLSSIPVYFFSFFKALHVSFLPLNLFLMHYFLRGVEDFRKIYCTANCGVHENVNHLFVKYDYYFFAKFGIVFPVWLVSLLLSMYGVGSCISVW